MIVLVSFEPLFHVPRTKMHIDAYPNAFKPGKHKELNPIPIDLDYLSHNLRNDRRSIFLSILQMRENPHVIAANLAQEIVFLYDSTIKCAFDTDESHKSYMKAFAASNATEEIWEIVPEIPSDHLWHTVLLECFCLVFIQKPEILQDKEVRYK